MDAKSTIENSLVSAISGMDRSGVPVKGSEQIIDVAESFDSHLQRHEDTRPSRKDATRPSQYESRDKNETRSEKNDDSRKAKKSDDRNSDKKTEKRADSSSQKEQVSGEEAALHKDVLLEAEGEMAEANPELLATLSDNADEMAENVEVAVQEVQLESSDDDANVNLAALAVNGESQEVVQVNDEEQVAVAAELVKEHEAAEKVAVADLQKQAKVVAEGSDGQEDTVQKEGALRQLVDLENKGKSQKQNTMKSEDAKGADAASLEVDGLDKVEESTRLTDESSFVRDSEDEAFEAELAEYEKNKQLQPKLNLKQFTDKLFISKHLNLESRFEAKVDNVQMGDRPFDLVQKNLVQDMKPLIQNLQINKEGGEMTVTLRPGNLGRVKVEVQVDQSNVVKVQMNAEHAVTRSMLSDQVRDLKQHLQQAGMQADDISVSTLKSEASGNQKDAQNQNQEQRQDSQEHAGREGRDQEREGRGHGRDRQQHQFAGQFLANELGQEVA